MKPKRPIYMAIMAAGEAGRGVSLSADEVRELCADDAICSHAAVGLPDDDDFVTDQTFTWTRALRARMRKAP